MNNRLTFLGDVYLDKAFAVNKELENFIFNLEYPVSAKGEPLKNKVNLRQKESYIPQTFGKMPLAVTLANNHIFDYGETAFEDTIRYLEHEKINYLGAGNKTNHYGNPLSLEIAGKKIRVFNYCGMEAGPATNISDKYEIAILNPDRISKDLKTLSGEDELKICILHWGEEEIDMPSPEEINLAHHIIDAGADIIIGHHPHVIKPLEIYKGKPVFYSLGNFLFPDLHLKTFWNGERFTRSMRKKQKLSNRTSLIVELDVLTRQYTVHKAVQKGNKVITREINLPDQSPMLNSPDYKNYYTRHYRKKRKKILLNAFLDNPRIPQAGSVKELISSLRS